MQPRALRFILGITAFIKLYETYDFTNAVSFFAFSFFELRNAFFCHF